LFRTLNGARRVNWIDGLNCAMGFIEENLTGEIDLAKVVRQAACSQFHLQRMFPYMTGMMLPDYIRRRRMSMAALDLAAGEKVIDVALRYGYESPTSFSRVPRRVRRGSLGGEQKRRRAIAA